MAQMPEEKGVVEGFSSVYSNLFCWMQMFVTETFLQCERLTGPRGERWHWEA